MLGEKMTEQRSSVQVCGAGDAQDTATTTGAANTLHEQPATQTLIVKTSSSSSSSSTSPTSAGIKQRNSSSSRSSSSEAVAATSVADTGDATDASLRADSTTCVSQTASETQHQHHHEHLQQQQQQQQQHQNNNQQQTRHQHKNSSNSNHKRSTRKPHMTGNDAQLVGGSTNAPNEQQVPVSADYLAQLIKDKKQLSAFPAVFMHVQRLIDDEIHKVRQALFQLSDVVHQTQPLELPEAEGELVQLQEKIYVPVEEHPEYNFVGRLLGPRGMTAKQLEQESGCKIMIRGRGSMRDKKKEEQNRGKANWEHLNDELHVLISVEDTANRAQVKLRRALDEVRQLLVPVLEGEDELKKRQLMELAIINGTYRDCNYNEALSKMLHDTNGLSSLGGCSPVAAAVAANQQVRLQHQQQQQFLGHQSATPGNGSSTSSGLTPSTGSNTPNSVQGLHQSHQQHQQHQKPPPGNPYLSSSSAAAAVVAAAAAAAAAQQHQHQHQHQQPSHLAAQQHQQHLAQQHLAAAHHLHPAGSPAHHHAHALAAAAAASNHLQHQHQHQQPAAVAAATAALMSANPDAALLYAQQYHDFHHYAAMVVAAQPLLAPDYAHHAHIPPPTHHQPANQHHHHHQQQQQQQQQYQQQQVDHLRYQQAPPPVQLEQPATTTRYQQHQEGAAKEQESENGNDIIIDSSVAVELDKAQHHQHQLVGVNIVDSQPPQQQQQQQQADLCGS